MEIIRRLKEIEKLLIKKKLALGRHEISQLIENCVKHELSKKQSLNPGNNYLQTFNELPLKIKTFGRFVMVLNGKKIVFQKKIQKRPLDLLKAIIVIGKVEISKSELSELLWPNSVGSARTSVINTTLSRLRKLVGRDAISTENGNIAINKKYCQVDYWELDDLIKKNRSSKILSQDSIQKIFSIYKGDFLDKDDHLWIVVKRKKIRDNLFLLLRGHCEQLIDKNQIKSAILFLKKCIAIDDIDEYFYQCLMECQIEQKLFIEAAETYQRCQYNMDSRFGILPSSRSQQIYQSLNHLTSKYELQDVK